MNPKRKPNFLWQGLLIVLPVVILAGIGFFSLRQDRIIAQQEAVERAQGIADDLLARVWNVLSQGQKPRQYEPHSFEVDAEGELVYPPPAGSMPIPGPFNVDKLSAEGARLWRLAQMTEIEESKFDA